MVEVKVNINNNQDRTINVFKAIHNLSSKQESIIELIKDWEKIQTMDISEIIKKVIERIKEENKEEIYKLKEKMRNCYRDYKTALDNTFKELCKKYKKSESEMNEILDGDQYEEGEDKLKDKVWNDWIKVTDKLQNTLPKKYNLKGYNVINHEEGWYDIEYNDERTYLNFNYSEYEEEIKLSDNKTIPMTKDSFEIRMDWKLEKVIEIAINILRGENSINNILKESKGYLK